jgi:hypothetical protein
MALVEGTQGMTAAQIVRLVLQGLVFLAWAALMFRTLFAFRTREAERTGAAFPSVGGFFVQAKRWLTSAEDRTDRRTLAFLTFVLVVMIAMDALAAAGRD